MTELFEGMQIILNTPTKLLSTDFEVTFWYVRKLLVVI